MTTSTQKIRLTRGKVAVVDAADYELVSKYNWHAVASEKHQDGTTTFYARTSLPKKNGKRQSIAMHNLILGCKPVDHQDGNGLNNRRSNLRPCNFHQNAHNKRPYGVSKFKGVSWHRKNKRWIATIKHNGKKLWLGGFHTQEDAAIVYNVAAQLMFGEYAWLNPV